MIFEFESKENKSIFESNKSLFKAKEHKSIFESNPWYRDYLVQNELKNSGPNDYHSDVKENGLVEHRLMRSDYYLGLYHYC